MSSQDQSEVQLNIYTRLEAYGVDNQQLEAPQINKIAVKWHGKYNDQPTVVLVSPSSEIAKSSRLTLSGMKIVVEDLLRPDVVIVGKELLRSGTSKSNLASKLKLLKISHPQ